MSGVKKRERRRDCGSGKDSLGGKRGKEMERRKKRKIKGVESKNNLSQKERDDRRERAREGGKRDAAEGERVLISILSWLQLYCNSE